MGKAGSSLFDWDSVRSFTPVGSSLAHEYLTRMEKVSELINVGTEFVKL